MRAVCAALVSSLGLNVLSDEQSCSDEPYSLSQGDTRSFCCWKCCCVDCGQSQLCWTLKKRNILRLSYCNERQTFNIILSMLIACRHWRLYRYGSHCAPVHSIQWMDAFSSVRKGETKQKTWVFINVWSLIALQLILEIIDDGHRRCYALQESEKGLGVLGVKWIGSFPEIQFARR